MAGGPRRGDEVGEKQEERLKRVIDNLTMDLFETPRPHPTTKGAWRFRTEIAEAISVAISSCGKDIYEIAADMGRMLDREVSVNTLRKYASTAAEDHVPNLETAMAFDAATGQLALITLWATKLGCSILPGKDKLLAELGRIELQQAELAQQEKTIKQFLGGRK